MYIFDSKEMFQNDNICGQGTALAFRWVPRVGLIWPEDDLGLGFGRGSGESRGGLIGRCRVGVGGGVDTM